MATDGKYKIHEFDPVIYPFRLWVTKEFLAQSIKESFYELNEKGHMVEFSFEEIIGSIAATAPVVDKSTYQKGCLVILKRPKDVGVGVISHEATHVVDWVCDTFGLSGFSFDDGEARAYLVQWVANCIEEVRRAKA